MYRSGVCGGGREEARDIPKASDPERVAQRLPQRQKLHSKSTEIVLQIYVKNTEKVLQIYVKDTVNCRNEARIDEIALLLTNGNFQ